MFNSISGTVTAKQPTSLFIENNGIEWEISVPALSIDSFGTVGSSARAYVWLYHREDQMKLFGFASPRERSLFLDLMKVEGVGPKQAIKILSTITVSDLEAALDSGDVARLQSAPGIGTKTAQKMILSLKGKLTYAEETGKGKAAAKSEHEDVVVALVGMGFDRKAALVVVDDAAREIAGAGTKQGSVDFEKELFRRAIVALSS
jgi:Holliday junction DNA helicase RuvA